MQERVYIVQTPVRDAAAVISDASLTHGQACHRTSWTKHLVNGKSD